MENNLKRKWRIHSKLSWIKSKTKSQKNYRRLRMNSDWTWLIKEQLREEIKFQVKEEMEKEFQAIKEEIRKEMT